MLEQDDHFKHLHDNPTYIYPEDWRAVDELIDWLIARNKAGYQMVNSVSRLQEMKAFMRMSSSRDLPVLVGTAMEQEPSDELLAGMPGISRDENGGLRFAELELPGQARTT